MATLFLIIIYITFIGLGLPDSMLGTAWPMMRIEFGMPLDFAGIASFIISGGTIVSSLLSEKLTSRFGAGRVTAVSVLFTATALLGIGFAPNFWWLLVLAVPLGLGGGAVDSALNNFIALHYKAQHMSWLHCFWGVGAFAGPLIMSAHIAGGNWRGGYLMVGIIQVGITALLFASLPLWKKKGITPGSDISPNQPIAQQAPAANALRIPGVVYALLTFMMYCAVEFTVGTWGSSFLVEARGINSALAAQWVSLFYLGITAGRLLTGFLTRKFSNPQLIRMGIVFLLAGALLLLLPLPAAFSVAALGLLGFGCAPVYPSMIHETPRRFGAANSSKVVGLQMAAAYTGSTLVPPLVGVLAGRVTIWTVPVFLLACSLFMLLCSERLNQIVKKALLFVKDKPVK